MVMRVHVLVAGFFLYLTYCHRGVNFIITVSDFSYINPQSLWNNVSQKSVKAPPFCRYSISITEFVFTDSILVKLVNSAALWVSFTCFHTKASEMRIKRPGCVPLCEGGATSGFRKSSAPAVCVWFITRHTKWRTARLHVRGKHAE